MRNKLLCILSVVLVSHSFAKSGGVGNGGDAIVCSDYVTLLDSYEAEKLGFTVDLSNPNTPNPSHRSMISVAVNRLSKKDKYTAKKLYDYSMEMVSDLEQFKMFPNSLNKYRGKVMYLAPDAVGEISDSKHRTLPVGCELRQLVSQVEPKRTRDNRYEINKNLWDKLSLVDQSMTILHEAWYRIMIEDGAKDSVGARYMNALAASIEFESYKFSDYIKDLQTTEKIHYIVENNSTLVFDSEFKVKLKNSDLEFKDSKVCTSDLNVKANIKKLVFLTTLHRGIADIKFTNVCFNNSIIESLTLPKKFSGKRINFVMENYLIRTNGLNGNTGVIKFNENGTFKELLNLDIAVLYKMFYKCKVNGKKIETLVKSKGCKGPYLHKKSKVMAPKDLIFNLDEEPVGYEFKTNLK